MAKNAPKGAMGSPWVGAANEMLGLVGTVGTNQSTLVGKQVPFQPEEIKNLVPKLSEVGTFLESNWGGIYIEVDGVPLRVSKIEKE